MGCNSSSDIFNYLSWQLWLMFLVGANFGLAKQSTVADDCMPEADEPMWLVCGILACS